MHIGLCLLTCNNSTYLLFRSWNILTDLGSTLILLDLIFHILADDKMLELTFIWLIFTNFFSGKYVSHSYDRYLLILRKKKFEI